MVASRRYRTRTIAATAPPGRQPPAGIAQSQRAHARFQTCATAPPPAALSFCHGGDKHCTALTARVVAEHETDQRRSEWQRPAASDAQEPPRTGECWGATGPHPDRQGSPFRDKEFEARRAPK